MLPSQASGLEKVGESLAKIRQMSFDEYQVFSRIGEGSIGGKARGLCFYNRIIKNYKLFNKFSRCPNNKFPGL